MALDKPWIPCTQGNPKSLSLFKTSLLYIIQRSSSWEKGIYLMRLWSSKSASWYQANMLWYVLMNYQHFDLKCLSRALAAAGQLLWSGRLCVTLTSLLLWTQYPLLLLDRRSIKMKLCFILSKCFDVQKGNCLSLVWCYCAISATVARRNKSYDF